MRIEAKALCVDYGAIRAVSDVDLVATPGEILAILGPNGSGKSSLLKALAGLRRFEGVVLFDGQAVAPERIGYMPQDIGSQAALTVLEVVLLGRLGRIGLRVGADDLAAVGDVLAEMGIETLAERYIGELSGGQRQLVFLAQALASQPSALLLDEPISALDIRHQLDVLEIICRLTRDRDLTTIMVVHDLAIAARYADKVVLLRDGRLRHLGAPEIVLTAEAIADVFDVEALIMRSPSHHPVVVPVRAAVPRTAP